MKISCCDGRKLTATEQTAIDYINQNTELVAELSITEIAERAFVSTATVSRAIRTNNYARQGERQSACHLAFFYTMRVSNYNKYPFVHIKFKHNDEIENVFRPLSHNVQGKENNFQVGYV